MIQQVVVTVLALLAIVVCGLALLIKEGERGG